MWILQTFHLSVALNISFSLLSAAKLQDGIIQTTEYLQYEECFGFHRAANAKESGLCAHPYRTQDKVLTAFHSALNMCLSKEITLCHIVLSLAFTTKWNPKHLSHCKCSVVFIILRIKNVKTSGYCFYMNTNIQGDFQICISVLLIIELLEMFHVHSCCTSNMKNIKPVKPNQSTCQQ